MFRTPLRRDPLVVIWALLMLAAGLVVLNNNTTWSGHLEPDRVARFVAEFLAVLALSLVVLFLAAWLRAIFWREMAPGGYAKGRPVKIPARESFDPFPWTDRWLRDWRQEVSERRLDHSQPAEQNSQVTCRHGVPVDAPTPGEQAPVLRALSVSHSIVRPGSSVSVTWCFEHGRGVVVDGRGGYPSCGEALVRIDRTRRIEVVGLNRHGSTPVATASVVAMVVPQLNLPTVASPPPVSLHTDVAASVGAAAPITQRLDDFWATQESLRPRLDSPVRLVGVPAPVIDGLRRARHPKGES
jgi:hypothetical protein